MRQGPALVLNPRACDRCGRCLDACPRDALRVGRTYLKVDPNACDGCGACVRACSRGAIMLPGGASRGRSATAESSRERAVAPPSATPRSRSARAAAAGTATAGRHPGRSRVAGGGTGAATAGRSRGFRWTLPEAIAVVSVTFSAFVVKEAVSSASWLADLSRSWEIPARVGVLALYYAAQVTLLLWLVHRRGGEPLEALGLEWRGESAGRVLGSVGLVLAGFVGMRVVASLYAYLTRSLGLLPSSQVDIPALFGTDTAGVLLAILMVVLVGPVVEEIVFRRALLEGLAVRFGSRAAIVVQAALFAALHRSLWLLLPTFALGVVLGYLAHDRERLWPAIALHALYNAVTVAAAFLVSVPPAG